MRALPVLALQDVLSGQRAELTEVQLHYSSNKDFEKTAKQLKIMSDLRVRITALACGLGVRLLVWSSAFPPHRAAFPAPPTRESSVSYTKTAESISPPLNPGLAIPLPSTGNLL